MHTFAFLPFTSAQHTLLADLYRRGSALDTVLLRPVPPIDNLYATGQAAALAALAALDYPGVRVKSQLPATPPEVPPLHIGPLPEPAPVGRHLPFAELLGPDYDLERQQARFYTPHCAGFGFNDLSGLAYALLDPPYRLDVAPASEFGSPAHTKEMGELLRSYLATVLHVSTPADAQALVCIEWTTNWHPYFEPGHEWWGAFCWTIYDHARATMAVLLAATTD